MQLWEIVLYVNPLTATITIMVMAVIAALSVHAARRSPERIRRGARVALTLWALVLLVATLASPLAMGDGYSGLWFGSLGDLFGSSAYLMDGERDRIAAQLLGNLLMFVPVGGLSCLAFPRMSAAVAVGFCTGASVLIECLQWVAQSGRTPDLDDILMNALGAAIGVALVKGAALPTRRGHPGRDGRRRHAASSRHG
ncbi:VanZ family protein [Streptomyces sp. NPDC002073]